VTQAIEADALFAFLRSGTGRFERVGFVGALLAVGEKLMHLLQIFFIFL
jgi:hypothetical protein